MNDEFVDLCTVVRSYSVHSRNFYRLLLHVDLVAGGYLDQAVVILRQVKLVYHN